MMKKCPYCGDDFLATTSRRKFCSPACRIKYYNTKHFLPHEIPQDKTIPSKTLSDWVREADECNLDYGSYRALIAMGKSFEQLKATADTRATKAHSHIRRC